MFLVTCGNPWTHRAVLQTLPLENEQCSELLSCGSSVVHLDPFSSIHSEGDTSPLEHVALTDIDFLPSSFCLAKNHQITFLKLVP